MLRKGKTNQGESQINRGKRIESVRAKTRDLSAPLSWAYDGPAIVKTPKVHAGGKCGETERQKKKKKKSLFRKTPGGL